MSAFVGLVSAGIYSNYQMIQATVNTALNGVFGVIEKASQGLDLIGSKFIDSITNLIYKFFKKKKEEDDYE